MSLIRAIPHTLELACDVSVFSAPIVGIVPDTVTTRAYIFAHEEYFTKTVLVVICAEITIALVLLEICTGVLVVIVVAAPAQTVNTCP